MGVGGQTGPILASGSGVVAGKVKGTKKGNTSEVVKSINGKSVSDYPYFPVDIYNKMFGKVVISQLILQFTEVHFLLHA